MVSVPALLSSELVCTSAAHDLWLKRLEPTPSELWAQLMRFAPLMPEERHAMLSGIETLLERACSLVVRIYDHLRRVPETAAILGWEQGVDEAHLAERRRFFAVWLARTLAVDTSGAFAEYLFHAGKSHAGLGPRRIHTPEVYVVSSMGWVLSAFAQYLAEAGLDANTLAQAISGWSKYLNMQLSLMLFGYRQGRALVEGEAAVSLQLYGRVRQLVGKAELKFLLRMPATLEEALTRFFNAFPETRADALERSWVSEETEALWTVPQAWYRLRKGWRVLVNGRDASYTEGLAHPLRAGDVIALFPPGR